MRGAGALVWPTHSRLPSFLDNSIAAVRICHRHCHSHPTVVVGAQQHKCQSLEEHYQRKATKYWNDFYKRHNNKVSLHLSVHLLQGQTLLGERLGKLLLRCSFSPNGKVLFEVGCGAGNTIFPLIATYHKLYVHDCDISPHAIELVKSHVGFKEDRINAFVCDVVDDSLSEKISPSSVDVVTLIFILSAVSPKNMPLILQNIKSVLKPNGYVLLRDYAIGDFAQVKLHNRNQMIGDGFYVRGDGTCSFYFSEDFLSSLFLEAGFNTVDISVYSRQIENRSRNTTMDRRWIRGIFKKECITPDSAIIPEAR